MPATSHRIAILDADEARHFGRLTFPYYVPRLAWIDDPARDPVVAAGAFRGSKPVALALAHAPPHLDAAQLISVFTDEPERRQGLGAGTVAAVCERLAAQGHRALRTCYERDEGSAPPVEGLLAQCGFPAPRPRFIVGRCETAAIGQAPWVRRTQIPAAFQVVPWLQVPDDRREALRILEGRPGWHDRSLSPFSRGPDLEPGNSLALLQDGQIVGWQITHRTDPRTIRYSTLFVRRDLARLGLGIPLLATAIRRHVDELSSSSDRAVFVVDVGQEPMVAFYRKHMASWIDRCTLSMETTRGL